MINVSELKACSDCGTVYASKLSKGVCPKCHSNMHEKITVEDTVFGRSLDR